MGDVISGAINTVEHVGSAIGDAVHGDFGGAAKDIGQALPGLVNTAVSGFMAMNPELGMLGSLGGILGGLTGAAGGFSPGQAGGLPGMFGLGNLLPGILQNPLGALFGNGSGGSAGGGGIGGGVPDFNQLAAGTQGLAGGDPNNILDQMKNINQGAEAFQLALSLEQVRHQESMAALKAMGQAFS